MALNRMRAVKTMMMMKTKMVTVNVNMFTDSTVTLHRPGTSAATGEKPQLSGQYIFSFKRGHLVMWVQPTNLLELPNIVSVVFVDNNIST